MSGMKLISERKLIVSLDNLSKLSRFEKKELADSDLRTGKASFQAAATRESDPRPFDGDI